MKPITLNLVVCRFASQVESGKGALGEQKSLQSRLRRLTVCASNYYIPLLVIGTGNQLLPS